MVLQRLSNLPLRQENNRRFGTGVQTLQPSRTVRTVCAAKIRSRNSQIFRGNSRNQLIKTRRDRAYDAAKNTTGGS